MICGTVGEALSDPVCLLSLRLRLSMSHTSGSSQEKLERGRRTTDEEDGDCGLIHDFSKNRHRVTATVASEKLAVLGAVSEHRLRLGCATSAFMICDF
jgi:hypothetical protein